MLMDHSFQPSPAGPCDERCLEDSAATRTRLRWIPPLQRFDSTRLLPVLREASYKSKRYREALELIVRPEVERRVVVPRIAFHFLDLDFRTCQRLARLLRLGGHGRVGEHVLHDPVVEPVLHVRPFVEPSDLV